jgi:hypothetical protein
MMHGAELRDRIQRARSATGDPAVVDPYVRALSSLADLVDAFFSALNGWRDCDIRHEEVHAAEKDLRAVVPERAA